MCKTKTSKEHIASKKHFLCLSPKSLPKVPWKCWMLGLLWNLHRTSLRRLALGGFGLFPFPYTLLTRVGLL